MSVNLSKKFFNEFLKNIREAESQSFTQVNWFLKFVQKKKIIFASTSKKLGIYPRKKKTFRK